MKENFCNTYKPVFNKYRLKETQPDNTYINKEDIVE